MTLHDGNQIRIGANEALRAGGIPFNGFPPGRIFA